MPAYAKVAASCFRLMWHITQVLKQELQDRVWVWVCGIHGRVWMCLSGCSDPTRASFSMAAVIHKHRIHQITGKGTRLRDLAGCGEEDAVQLQIRGVQMITNCLCSCSVSGWAFWNRQWSWTAANLWGAESNPPGNKTAEQATGHDSGWAAEIRLCSHRRDC